MDEFDPNHVPELGEPEIPGDEAEARGLVWARDSGRAGAAADAVPVAWVEDAVRGALAQHEDDIVASALEELRRRMEQDADRFD